MRKLKLESLEVESFATTWLASASPGTVDAHATPAPGAGCDNTSTTPGDTRFTVCGTCPDSICCVPQTQLHQGCIPPTMNLSGCGSGCANCSLNTGCPVCYVEGPSPTCPISG